MGSAVTGVCLIGPPANGIGALPDFELTTPDRGLGFSGVFRGPERARLVFEDFFGPFEDVTIEPETVEAR
jgi:hypothetical protein